jgi:hypothetical protein
MTKHPLKRFFLLDGLGALLTGILLYAVLVQLEEYFGMPRKILYVLSTIAFGYASYSMYCYFFIAGNLRYLLRIIAVANSLYCLLTATLAILYYKQLSVLGIAYFIVEICVIVILVMLEWKAIRMYR